MLPLLFAAVLLQTAEQLTLPRGVPYLPQTEALCGGAAAAMVMRYWGGDTRPEEFAGLIDPAQDGIVTTTLVADLRRRGWQAFPLRGAAASDALFRDHLSRGRPVIVLIEDRPSRYHYVVITAVGEARVHFHDPAVAPSQSMARAEFDRRWAAANYWALLLLPGGTPAETSIDSPPASDGGLASDVAALLRNGRTDDALRMAMAATGRTPSDATAWDAVGTTLFVMDREAEALDAWNRAGKPDIDTVQIAGLARTRYRAAEQLIDLEPGARLTSGALRRARRRLAWLPSASAARVSYAPRPDGRVQIDAAIAERARLPGAADLAAAAIKAPFSRDVAGSFTNVVGGGERVTAAWRFRGGFERIEAAVETPAPLPLGAVWKISGFDARETYRLAPDAVSDARWQRAGFQAADWVTSSIGWAAGAAFERWPTGADDDPREKLLAGLRVLAAAGDWFDAHVTAEGWMRGAGATRLRGLARASTPAGGGRLAMSAGLEGVHGRTPMFLWPGAGDGHVRAPYLRAHPLIDDGAIGVDNGRLFARRLAHGTIEWTRPIARLAFVEIGAAAFTDAARAWQLLDGRLSDYQIDAGAGLRLRVLGGGPALRLDIARGLRDGRWALTAGTAFESNDWIW